MRPRLLDLFCGAGGAAVGYARAGFEVVGVDVSPQSHYPFEFIEGDAIEILQGPLGSSFDVIHASPPCQRFSAYRRRRAVAERDYPDFISATRIWLRRRGKPYVIENVPGAPLVDPFTLCGSSFGLDIRRHRWFEASTPMLPPPCDHAWQTPRFPHATNRANLRSTVEVGSYRCAGLAAEAMGIDWMTNGELSQALPPVYTEWIGHRLVAGIKPFTVTGSRNPLSLAE